MPRDFTREYRVRNKDYARLHSMQSYRRMRARTPVETLRTEWRRKSRLREMYWMDVAGLPYWKALLVRRELRERAARTGENFLELAYNQNMLSRRERKQLGLEISPLLSDVCGSPSAPDRPD